MSEFKHVGTVEVLRERVYPLDPQSNDITGTTVVVEAGHHPLYSDGYTYVWLMEGDLNGNFMRRGDGLFTGGHDEKTGLRVRFPSPFFGPDEWRGMVSHPTAQEGHPEQRLRITILENA
jgi:hypothetical protein